VAAVAAAASLIVRFRRARGVARQQLKWLAYAMGVLMIVPVVQDSWLGGWAKAAADLAQWAIPAAIGVAILRYRLYDIDRLINRTLVYGLLTAMLAAVYAAVVLALGQLFGGIGTEPPSWAVAGATLAVAALFQPARRRHPAGRGPTLQPPSLRHRQDRRGVHRAPARRDRPGHAVGRATGGGRPDHAAHPSVTVAPPIGARVTACCYLNTTVLGLCRVKRQPPVRPRCRTQVTSADASARSACCHLILVRDGTLAER
jgi:hypothetical protein